MTNAKWVVVVLAGLLGGVNGGVYAQQNVSETAVPSAATDKSARVTVLDKQTNRRQTLVMVAGQAQTVGSLDLKLTKCLPDYAAQLGQDVAWLDITESANGNGSRSDWFSGWMFNTYPEVSTLDHPRYDVILQGCGTKARKIVQTVGAAPVIETQEEIIDTETVAEPPASLPANGADFAVPGVPDASPAPKPEPLTQETPASAAPVTGPVEATPPAKPQGQQDLHELMDSGTY